MSRFIAANTDQGFHDLVGVDNPYTRFLRFGIVRLAAGETHSDAVDDAEALAVILTGTTTAQVGEQSWNGLGGRSSVFDGPGTSVYVPVGQHYSFTAETDVEIAICFSRAEEVHEAFVVTPEQVTVSQRGEQNWRRTIRDILTDAGDGRVAAIVAGETINHPGDWSSYPPHKHDGEFAPDEAAMEEIYHYRLDPVEGFGVQLHYTGDRAIDDAHIVREGDTFVIERGYHPLVAAGGHSLYYLWFMAGGTGRALKPYIEPEFRWLL